MKKVSIKSILIACLFVSIIMTGQAIAAGKVVVISGVSEAEAVNVGTYALVYDGIKQVLGDKNVNIEFQYAALDSAPDEAAKVEVGKQAAAAARAANPDLIMVLNDNSVKYVAMSIDDLPVVFCYIFGDPKSLGLPKANITGVARRSFAPDIWGLAKQLFGTKTVSLLSKDGTSMAAVRKILAAKADGLEKLCGVRYQEMYLVNTFDEWQHQVANFPSDLIYLADTSRIEKDGRQMSREEVTEWTVANAKVPVVAASEFDCKAGALYAIILSETEIGRQASKIALSILDGKSPSDIPIQPTSKGKLVINAKTAQQYKIDIPYEILSTAEKIYE